MLYSYMLYSDKVHFLIMFLCLLIGLVGVDVHIMPLGVFGMLGAVINLVILMFRWSNSI